MSDRVVRVGDLGTAATPMCPSGLVLLDGRRLDARADGEAIPAGTSVVVLRGDPTGYLVRRVGPDHPLPQLPNAGAEIARPEFARNSSEVRKADARDEDERRREWDRAARNRASIAALVGTVGGIVTVSLARGNDIDTLLRGGAIGSVLGVLLATAVAWLGRFLGRSHVAANVAVLCGLVGAAVGYWTQHETGDRGWIAAGIALGAVIGLIAGWWVATRLEMVFGGPDEV
jgi:hypothetical protein